MPVFEELDDDGNPLVEEVDEELNARIAAEEKKERERVEKQFALGEEHRVKGNELLGEGDLKGALDSYKNAQRELTMVGNQENDRKRAEQANLALHLNRALVYLKSERYEDVKQECNSALAIDPANVKALYRRGTGQASLARQASLFQEAEARAACADFEAILKVEPGNAQAEKELQRLRAEIRSHERELRDKQRETWGAVFGGKTQVEGEEEELPDTPLPAVRPCKIPTDKHLIYSLEGVSVKNEGGKPILKDMNMEVRESWCMGFCSTDLPAGVAITQLLQGKMKPASGQATVHEKKRRAGRRNNAEPMSIGTVAYPSAALLVVLLAVESASMSLWQTWLVRFLVVSIISVLIMVFRQDRQPARVEVRVATWKPHVLLEVDPQQTLSEVLGSLMQRQVNAQEKRDRVAAMLSAAGITAETGAAVDMKFNRLSNEKQRVVHVLRSIAARPEVIVLEDPFQGLPVETQARLLRMFKQLKQKCSVSILFFSPDLDQVSYLADSLSFMANGELIERGPTLEVLETPRSEQMQAHIASFLEKRSQEKVGGKVQAKCVELIQDRALDGAWVPPKYT